MITVSARLSSSSPNGLSNSSPSAVRTGPSWTEHNRSSYHQGTGKSSRPGSKTSHGMASSNIGKPAVTGMAIRCMAVIYLKLSFLPLVAPARRTENKGMTNIDTRSRVLSWVALGVVYLVWGSTYLAIRVGVGHLPPLLFAGTRYVIAGTLLYPIARRAASGSRASAQQSAQHSAQHGAKAWLAGAVIGILLLFAGNGGVT